MTVSHSHLAIVPTQPGRADVGSPAVLRGCPVAEPAVPSRFVTAGSGWPRPVQARPVRGPAGDG
jgi:hypothetical protein